MNKTKKLNSLQDLPTIVTPTGMSWEQVQEKLQSGKVCARRSSWPIGDIMWCKSGSRKYRNKNTADEVFYWPVDTNFMKRNGWKELHIQGHYNRLRFNAKSIQVGYWPSQVDRVSNDWELVEP